MQRPNEGNRIFRKQEGNDGKSTRVIQSKYGAGNSFFWIHSNEEWRVTAKNVKITKGNNKAKLAKQVTQDMKEISSTAENNACKSYIRSDRVYGKILGTFFKVCKKYQYVYRVSQKERTKLRESVPYVKLYRYNPKHLYPKLNGYRDNGQRKVWTSCISAYCTSTAVWRIDREIAMRYAFL